MADPTQGGNGDNLSFLLAFQRATREVCEMLEVSVFNGPAVASNTLIAAEKRKNMRFAQHARHRLLASVRRQTGNFRGEEIYNNRTHGQDGYQALLKLLQDEGIDPIEQALHRAAREAARRGKLFAVARRRSALVREELRSGQINSIFTREDFSQYRKYRSAVVAFTEAAIQSLAANPQEVSIAYNLGYRAYRNVVRPSPGSR